MDNPMAPAPGAGSSVQGALHGLRVLDLTDDLGRFSSKLFTTFGADVVRLTTAGDQGRPIGTGEPGVLDWWYDGGKRRLPLDLDRPSDVDRYRQLAARADLIVESTAPGFLADRAIDHADLAATSPGLIQLSITPFGRTGPRAHWQTSDLVAAAMGGVLSCTGGPDEPLNLWGRQAFNFAGYLATVAGLAAVRAVRRDGHGRHVDVSMHEALTGNVEHILLQLFYDELLPDNTRIAARQAALHWMRIFNLAPTVDGTAMITPTPVTNNMVLWMLDEGHDAAASFVDMDAETAWARRDELMACIAEFVGTRSSGHLGDEALHRHSAVTAVVDIAQAAANPQFEHRHFFADARDGETLVRMPARPARFSETPCAPPAPPPRDAAQIETLLAEWAERPGLAPTTGESPGRLGGMLDGIRVADFTWVLAGPSCTRALGDLGADVVRVQHTPRATEVNKPGVPYYSVWNRSKRSITLDLKHDDGLAAARRLIEQADVVIENFSAGVFASLGLDWDTMRSWNPRLIYVTMSGCGHDGPLRDVVSYAMTVHALTGLTHLTNFEGRCDMGAGFSVADHLAGFAAATSTLAAVEAREHTGRGQLIDLAQVEVCAHAIGPAFIEHFVTGDAPEPHGNRDGLHDHVPNEVHASNDNRWVAVSAVNDAQWAALASELGGAVNDPALATVQARREQRSLVDQEVGEWIARHSAADAVERLQAIGVPAGEVLDAEDLHCRDPQHDERQFWSTIETEVFGQRPVDRFPAIIDGVPLSVERRAPAYLGEHNFEVWGDELGYGIEAVAEAMATGLFD